MKKVILYFLFSMICLYSYGQLQGSFSYAQDGHIYFYLSNPTGYQIPVVWGVYNLSKNEQRQNQGVMTPGGTFVYGPNANWVWEKGERFAVTYSNGQTVYWTCPETDSALRNRSNPSFKGDATPPNASSDGYIYQGTSVKVGGYYYKLYKKNGQKYIYDKSGGWIKID